MENNEPKTTENKLYEDYIRSAKKGNAGHMIGFYNESKDEIIKARYRFQTNSLKPGVFTIKSKKGNFYWWDFELNQKEKGGKLE